MFATSWKESYASDAHAALHAQPRKGKTTADAASTVPSVTIASTSWQQEKARRAVRRPFSAPRTTRPKMSANEMMFSGKGPKRERTAVAVASDLVPAGRRRV